MIQCGKGTSCCVPELTPPLPPPLLLPPISNDEMCQGLISPYSVKDTFGKHMSNPMLTKLPAHQTASSPNCQLTKLPAHQTASSPNCQLTKLPAHQTASSPNCQLTKLPAHQTASSPNCQLTKLPAHQTAICQLILFPMEYPR